MEEQKNKEIEQKGALDEFLQTLTQFRKRYLEDPLLWYKTKKRWPRRFFICSNLLVTALSLSIPILVTFEGPEKKYLLLIIPFSIAFLNSISPFLQWQKKWQTFSEAEVQLEKLLYKWDLLHLEAKQITDEQKRIEQILAETETILEQANNLIHVETEGFFSGLRPIQVSTKNSPESNKKT